MPARGSIALVGDAAYGANVSFAVDAQGAAKPWVEVRCTKDGELVFHSWAGYFPAYNPGPGFLLDSDWWRAAGGGPADGYARLVTFNRQGRDSTLAETTFPVAGVSVVA